MLEYRGIGYNYMNEHSIPDTSDYKICEDGTVVSYKGKTRRVMKRYKKKRYGSRHFRETQILRLDGKTITRTIARIQLASILGRWPEEWEQARHLDGDPLNNSRNNIAPGCLVLNAIDDLELGTKQTRLEYIEEAIERLQELKKNFK